MFFANSFSNVFNAQQKLEGTQGHFVINKIIQDKFTNLAKVPVQNSSDVIIQNQIKEGVLPFTYIGLNDGKLVFKDFFMFDGVYEDKSSSDYDVKNPAGITKVGSNYYVVAPLENAIYSCSNETSCSPLSISGLKNPIGITTDGTDLYVADAGNNRIVKITVATSAITLVSENLNFPVGIDYYNEGSGYLFFSEPYENKVYRVKTDGTNLKVVVGDGDNEDCDNTALYCKLDFPTGLHVDGTDLYIADTGSGRVLKVSDPGNPKNTPPNENILFTFDDDIAVEKIIFSNFSDEIFVSSSMTSSLSGSYDVPTHTMTSGSVFTTYENVGCGWVLNGGTTLYTNTDPNGLVDIGDKIALQDNGNMEIYTVTGVTSTRLKCPNPMPPPLFLDQTFAVYLDGNMTNVTSGTFVYFAAKNDNVENIILDFSSATFPAKGFQNININIYEFGNVLPVKTYEHLVRVGNGILGTPEDIITDVTPTTPAPTYPTGVYWNDSSLEVGDEINFDEENATFDYTTDFEIDDLTFTQPNGGAILQATITIGEQEYIINGAVSEL